MLELDQGIKMDRKTIIEKLSRLRFCLFYPGDWDDIGFTERQIWINSVGYGYISDDVPCRFVELNNLTDDLLASIKTKLLKNDLSIEDLRGTTFEDLFYDFNQDGFNYLKPDLLRLPDHCNSNGSLFCGETFDGWLFFDTEEELIGYFEELFTSTDGNYGMEWQEMDDNLLSCWYTRIFEEEWMKEKDYHDLPLTLDIFKED